jgi:hypothetical protein
MTPLEKRLIEDMKLFGYSKRTQDTYLYAVRKITNHFQTSPDQITNEQLREYLLWHKDKYAPNTTTIALCGNERAQGWLEKTGSLLLPTEHFMVTFTLPGDLRRVARSHQRLFYGLLMRCAAQALQTLGWDSRFVGGQLAMMGVLHTWGRDLSYHPHVHMIVAGGKVRFFDAGEGLIQNCSG